MPNQKSPENLSPSTPRQLIPNSSLQSNREHQPQTYRIQKNIPIIKKQTQVTVRIIKLQVLVILISIIIFATVYGIKYLVINSTQPCDGVKYCQDGTRQFDGWMFYINCTKCQQGYVLDKEMNQCKVDNNVIVLD